MGETEVGAPDTGHKSDDEEMEVEIEGIGTEVESDDCLGHQNVEKGNDDLVTAS